MIQIKNISKTFTTRNGQVHALKDVSADVENGDILGVVGTSGAGKSTFVRCINLLERPDEGEIIIDGKAMTTLSPKELEKERAQIGMIFQQFNLMSQRTVFRNIAYPLEYKGISKEDIAQRVNELLRLVGLPDKSEAYPAQLSGGQKQRVAIARALASNPKVLLCDEATSALDPETTKSILKLLKDISIKLNLSLIVITHQKEVVREICNKIIVLEHGQVVERGSALDIFTRPQSKAAKSFTGEISEQIHVKQVLSALADNTCDNVKLTKLIFIGSEAGEPYISYVSSQFNIAAAILFGHIDIIQEQTVGILIVKMEGNPADIQKAINYLEENNVVATDLKKLPL